MKRNFKKLGLMLMLSALTISVSCSDDSNSESNTIASIASKNAEFSTLVTALNKTGLTATLNGSGNFTVFAPTNQAFSAFLSANGFSSLDDVPGAVLKEILLNHVVNDELFSNELTTGYVKSLGKGSASSTNTLSLFINTTSGVKINGVSNVTAADIDASNGVIHKVDAVIGLPTIVTHAVANPNFTSLVAALTRSDQADQNFVGILSGTASSPFTVFAPTNTAFSSLLTEFGWSSLGDVPETVLEKTLKYHVVAGANVLSTQLTNNMSVGTFLGQNFTITTTGGAKITDANNRTSNIIATDVQCANGVIHVIDKVIVPSLD
ncbi:beta-Ig-H3/fasciclin domain-containing protein [Flavobacterium lutivivi]|nr:beta-Ig-H3/fasciclin domain-containing protein [Flavobacterium lutivivi]